MKTRSAHGRRGCRMWWVAVLVGCATGAHAQGAMDDAPELIERDLSGPRFGFTVRDPGASTRDVGRIVSQFGWHFEHHVSPVGGGPQFVLEFVPLVAGVEYGAFVPSASFGVGVRLANGYEFGLGPTFSASRGASGAGAHSALFFAAGRSFDVGGVHLPVNLVLATNSEGSRASLIAGYAIRRSARAIEP